MLTELSLLRRIAQPTVVALYAVFAVFMLAAGGCDQQVWNNPYGASSMPVSKVDSNVDSSAGAADTDLPKHEMIYYGNFIEAPKELDPVRSYSSDESVFVDQIYEPPLQYHYLKRPFMLEPLLLQRLPDIERLDDQFNVINDASAPASYTRYRLTLKEGIQYQPHPAFATYTEDALIQIKRIADFDQLATREVTADDFIYQIKRLADAHNGSPIRGLLAEYILGMEDFNQWAAAQRQHDPQAWLDLGQQSLSGVEKIGATTFTITLKGEYPQFIYWLAMHFFAPIPREVDQFYQRPGLQGKNISLSTYPVGTGPFHLVVNEPNREMVLARNPNYHEDYYPTHGMAGDKEAGWLADAGQRLPLLDKAVYRLEKESIPAWAKFMQGYYDQASINSDNFDVAVQMSAGQVGLSEGMQALGITLSRAIKPGIFYMGFNMLDPVVGGYSEAQRKLRQAITLAYDDAEFIAIFRNGRGQVAQSPIPPGIFGFQTGEAGLNPFLFQWQDAPTQGPIKLGLEHAKQLLVEAGYANGIDPSTGTALVLHMDITQRGDDQARLQWMVKQFAKLGIELNIRGTDYNRFKEKMSTGNAQMFHWGWLADYPDPENFLFLLVGANGQVVTQGAGVNSANYENRAYDELFKEMKRLPNGEARQAIIDKMLAIVREDAPWGFGWHPERYSLNNPWVFNTKPNTMAHNTLKYLRVDTAMRTKAHRERNQPKWLPLLMGLGVMLGLAILVVKSYRSQQQQSALPPLSVQRAA